MYPGIKKKSCSENAGASLAFCLRQRKIQQSEDVERKCLWADGLGKKILKISVGKKIKVDILLEERKKKQASKVKILKTDRAQNCLT